jgi:hypothetical protein
VRAAAQQALDEMTAREVEAQGGPRR